MFFFMSYYLIRFFFSGTYWIASKSASGIYYLVKKQIDNQKLIKDKKETIENNNDERNKDGKDGRES